MTDCMEHSPSWEADRSSASQEFPCILPEWYLVGNTERKTPCYVVYVYNNCYMFRPLIKCRDVRYSGLDIRENPLVCFCTVWLCNEITGTLQIVYLIKITKNS